MYVCPVPIPKYISKISPCLSIMFILIVRFLVGVSAAVFFEQSMRGKLTITHHRGDIDKLLKRIAVKSKQVKLQ